MFERRSLLFDLGDISSLSPRKIIRLESVFVSHTHVDHFIGFDHLLRVLVGREKSIRLFGPEGFIGNVEAKLRGYRWNLATSFKADLTFLVTEVVRAGEVRRARFNLRRGFVEEPLGTELIGTSPLLNLPHAEVRCAVLDHLVPVLAFAMQESAHLNVWKSRLEARGLATGAWLHGLKRAIAEGRSDEWPVQLGAGKGENLPLGALRDLVTVTPGQKIAYVTDVRDTRANRAAITELARGADILFIEAAFAADDHALAYERAHLTTKAAGEIARAAGVRRAEPFHFSPRYKLQEERLLREVAQALGE